MHVCCLQLLLRLFPRTLIGSSQDWLWHHAWQQCTLRLTPVLLQPNNICNTSAHGCVFVHRRTQHVLMMRKMFPNDIVITSPVTDDPWLAGPESSSVSRTQTSLNHQSIQLIVSGTHTHTRTTTWHGNSLLFFTFLHLLFLQPLSAHVWLRCWCLCFPCLLDHLWDFALKHLPCSPVWERLPGSVVFFFCGEDKNIHFRHSLFLSFFDAFSGEGEAFPTLISRGPNGCQTQIRSRLAFSHVLSTTITINAIDATCHHPNNVAPPSSLRNNNNRFDLLYVD